MSTYDLFLIMCTSISVCSLFLFFSFYLFFSLNCSFNFCFVNLIFMYWSRLVYMKYRYDQIEWREKREEQKRWYQVIYLCSWIQLNKNGAHTHLQHSKREHWKNGKKQVTYTFGCTGLFFFFQFLKSDTNNVLYRKFENSALFDEKEERERERVGKYTSVMPAWLVGWLPFDVPFYCFHFCLATLSII